MKTWLGIDLGGTNMRVGVVRQNALLGVKTRPVPQTNDSRIVYDALVQLIRESMTPEINGIGVAVPGAVDHERGVVYNLNNIPSWIEVPLKTLFENEFKIDTEINNDANAFVIGEKHFGQARDFNNVVGLILGTGMGSGMLMNGQLYTGANGGAGEFGMLPYEGGILEDYCSGKFFTQHAGITGKEAADRAGRGDSHAQALFFEFGKHLGAALKTVVYAVDPEMIVLGGSISKAIPYFKTTMLDSLNSLIFPRTLARLKITCSAIEHIAILGAAAFCMERNGK